MEEKKLYKILKETFEWFHRHPELSYEEVNTTKKIKVLLEKRNIEILGTNLETGLVGIIRGKKEKPVVTLRCDIDALPINEEADLDYKSNTAGKMHACGHDFHTTSIIGAAYLLMEMEEELGGTVKLLFQPAEESSHGAKQVIASNVLEDVDVIFGLHVMREIEAGGIGVIEGNGYAAVDRFTIDVEGVGCHGAQPYNGIDPIVISCQLVEALQTIISRNINPTDPAVISVTSIHGGNTWNVIPTSAQLEGTVRTLNPNTREFIYKRMKETSEYFGKAFGANITLNWWPGPPATNNDPDWTQFASHVAQEEGLKVVSAQPTMGGEDFAFYQEEIKGTFINIGIGDGYPLHHPKFELNKDVLPHSARLFASIARKALIRLGKEGSDDSTY